MLGSIYVATGILSFLGGAALVNVYLISRRHYSYEKNYVFFTGIYLASIIVLAFGMGENAPPQTIENFALIVLSLGVYTGFALRLERIRPIGDFQHVFQVPKEYGAMLYVSAQNGWVKVWEILMQQMMAYMIVVGLQMLHLPLVLISGLFALIVWLLHVPGLRLFGPVFGNFFLWASTLVSCLYPFVIQHSAWGWGCMIIIHVSAYILWYTWVWYGMRQHQKQL